MKLAFPCFVLGLLFTSLIPLASAQTLVIAQLSDRPKKDYKQLRPMVEYAAERLSHLGISRGEVKLYDTPEALVKAVKNGEVHWITETPYTASILVHDAGAHPLLMKWKSNQRRYQTLIYTRKDSPIQSIGDLAGKRIAFEHNTSFSSYLLPRILIEKRGLKLNQVRNSQDPVNNEQVNYLFSRNEKNNLLWVHKGIVDAGALNNGDWNNPKRVPKVLKDDLKIIFRSAFYPRALELVGPGLSPTIRNGLKELLLSLNKEQHAGLLHRYEKTAGFEELTPDLNRTLHEVYSFRQRYIQ